MSVDIQGILAMASDINPDDIISDKDLVEYFNTILEAFGIHVDRERIRRGLWKKARPIDQARMIKIKGDRIMHSLEGAPSQEQLDNVVEELLDIINYSVFTIRQIRGTA